MTSGKYTITVTKRAYSSYIVFSTQSRRKFFTITVDNKTYEPASLDYDIGWESIARKLEISQQNNIRTILSRMENLPIGSQYRELIDVTF